LFLIGRILNELDGENVIDDWGGGLFIHVTDTLKRFDILVASTIIAFMIVVPNWQFPSNIKIF
jgi:hypothetical protein